VKIKFVYHIRQKNNNNKNTRGKPQEMLEPLIAFTRYNKSFERADRTRHVNINNSDCTLITIYNYWLKMNLLRLKMYSTFIALG